MEKDYGIFDKLPAKFCGMVEEYRLELAKKSGIDMQLDVSLAGTTICGIHETVLISKKFGFIKWLVDNDKIDTTNKFTLMANVENKENGLGYAHTFEGYDALIMLLSIQDNPIEFLVSILK